MQEREIIFGAPGCGKTTYLIEILKKELKQVIPQRIAAVSFTKKGAYEILTKAIEEFKYDEKEFLYFKTLHAICFKELQMSRYDMLSKLDYRNFSKAMNMNFVGYYTEDFKHNDDRYLYLYLLKDNNYEMYKTIRDAYQQNIHILKHVAKNYNRYKNQYDKYDFTDLLKSTLNKNIKLDIDVAIIDEAQDLTTLQWEVCEMLFANAKRVYIAGDDDQAIYQWTGADVNYFLNLEGKRTILDKSWRLKSNLLDFAKKISAKIEKRVDKNFKPYEDGGEIIFYNSIKDFEFNEDETYYCLARNNYFLKRYIDELKKQTKIFTHKHKSSADPNVIFAINNYERYKENILTDSEAMKIRKLLRNEKIVNQDLKWFEVFNLSQEDISYYRQLIQQKIEIIEPKITVSTIHGVKGGEADNVILLMDITKIVYQQLFTLNDSELRCLYVACTRAKSKLHIIYEETKHSYRNIFKELKDEHNL